MAQEGATSSATSERLSRSGGMKNRDTLTDSRGILLMSRFDGILFERRWLAA